MLFVNSGQFNCDSWQFANFPDIFGDATAFVSYVNNFI